MIKLVKKIGGQYREAYRGLPQAAWLLSLVEFVNRSGSMVFFYFALYLTQTYHYTATQAGQTISAFGVGALLGAWLGGKLTDRLGSYSLQKMSLMLNGLLLILLGYIPEFSLILLTMFFIGLVSEMLHPANATAMSQICPAAMRTKGFALQRLAVNLGVAIGPMVGGYLALINYKLIFWIDGLTCLAAGGIFMFFFRTARPVPTNPEESPAPVEPTPPPTPTPSPRRDTYFMKILAYSFLMGLTFVQLFGPYSIYMKTIYSLKENQIGFLMFVNTIIIVLFEMLLMETLKKRKLEYVIGTGEFLLCAGFALMPLSSGFGYAIMTVVVWTLGEMLAMPSLTALVANHSPEAARGQYMGLLSLSFALALFVGPAAGTWVYDHAGPTALWLGVGALGVIMLAGFLLLNNNKHQITPECLQPDGAPQ